MILSQRRPYRVSDLSARYHALSLALRAALLLRAMCVHLYLRTEMEEAIRLIATSPFSHNSYHKHICHDTAIVPAPTRWQ